MRLVNLDDERFWEILADEACVEGVQAKRIDEKMNEIIAYDYEGTLERLEEKSNDSMLFACEADAYLGALEIIKEGTKIEECGV